MADETDKDQKTQEASEKRLQDLRKDGKLAKSVDVISTSVFLMSAFALYSFGGAGSRSLGSFAERIFALEDRGRPFQAIWALMPVLNTFLLPVLAAGFFAALIAGLAQTKGFFSMGMAAPKAERMNPLTNIKNVLPGKASLLEIGKAIAKLTVVGVVVYGALRDEMPRFSELAGVEALVGAREVGLVALRVLVRASLAFALIAAVDYFFAWRNFRDESMMSKQEQKDEHKQEEGDPHVKAKIRGRMRQAARNRAVLDVKNATVLVTNPTHYAIALRYVPEKDAAPVLLAKGSDDLALKMRSQARKHRIPIVENRPLARALYAQGKAGRAIPIDLYQAAAGVIAHVLKLRARDKGAD